MKLIVGLGNPGAQYQLTRHNIGFILVDALVEAFHGNRNFKSEFKSLTQKIEIGGEAVLLCKPQTFMNLSGEAVQPLMAFYRITLAELLVAHDEVDQPFGQLKFQIKRGHGGHNGIRNIHQLLGTDDYARLRLGVGRPTGPMSVADFVLQNFSREEMVKLPDLLDIAIQGVEVWLKEGIQRAATKFNGREVNE